MEQEKNNGGGPDGRRQGRRPWVLLACLLPGRPVWAAPARPDAVAAPRWQAPAR
ncbi:MAG: hypothetical protein ACLT5P_15085 [Flavonifractor plautii]